MPQFPKLCMYAFMILSLCGHAICFTFGNDFILESQDGSPSSREDLPRCTNSQVYWRWTNEDSYDGYYVERWQDCYTTTGIFPSTTLTYYQDFVCTCRAMLAGNYYADQFYIMTPCHACSGGQIRQNCGGTSAGQCVSCPAGTIITSTFASCLECKDDEYAEDFKSCKSCKPCDAVKNEANKDCVGNKAAVSEGTCECDKGYYKGKYGTCDPVDVGYYKDEVGNSGDLTKKCVNTKGVGFTTISTGSTSKQNCVCKQNYELDTSTEPEQCKSCSMRDNTPYNAIGGPNCRACHPYEYWTNNACQNLSRMELSFEENSQFSIVNHDSYRSFTPNNFDQQKQSIAVDEGQYLDIATHQPLKCQACAAFHKRHACGAPHPPTGSTGDKKQIWVTWRDDNGIERINNITTPISYDSADQGFNSYTFWKSKHDHNNLKIKREGKCVRCHECAQGSYQSQCIDGDANTCKPCLDSTDTCPSSDSYLYHILSNFENSEWKGGCQRAINIAETDYECRPCNKWRQIGDDYYLSLGCGDTASDTRWHEDGNTNDQNKLEEITEVNNAKNIYRPYISEIPYCTPGWYVDTNATGCPLKNQDKTTAWNTECCRKCGDTFEAQMKRAANFKPCTGATTSDTEVYTDRCDNGYYASQLNGQAVCERCTTC